MKLFKELGIRDKSLSDADILKSLKRQALHAHTLGFVHPKTNQDVFLLMILILLSPI